MDTILIGFCLVSFTITVCLVLLELARNSRAKIQIPEVELREFFERKTEALEGNTVEEKDRVSKIDQADFLRMRIEEALRQQLNQLGYGTEEEQLNFISELFQEEKKSLSSLNPSELRRLLNGIIVEQEPPQERGMQHRA